MRSPRTRPTRATQGLSGPGAGRDLAGARALNRKSEALAELGFRCMEIPEPARPRRSAHGVGDAATVMSAIIFLLCFGGFLGVVEAGALLGNVPRILSVSLVEFLRA